VTEIIGLSGFARSGKDEAAKVLVQEFGFTRVAFADKLREMLYALNPIVQQKTGWSDMLGNKVTATWTVQDVIDVHGWDGYKETVFGAEIRRLLQRLGTEAGRQILWDTIWIDAALNTVNADKIVVTDARFYNEFDAVRDRGGEIWRIERLGVGPANSHASEMEAVNYPHFRRIIRNDGSLEDYHTAISNAYRDFKLDRRFADKEFT
jgi:hypothetical protein